MKRRTARENAFIAAFEATFHSCELDQIIAYSRECGEYAVDEYGEALLVNYAAHLSEIDDMIRSKLKEGWSLERLPRVNRTLLRLAVAEMRFCGNTDMDSIVINETVELAKKYAAGEEDYQFINGVLGSIARQTALPAEG